MALRFTTVTVPSSWGVDTWNRLSRHEPPSPALTVLFPGANYPCEGPLLWYAGKGAVQAGADVLALEYGYRAAHAEPDFDTDRQRIVDEAVSAIEQVTAGSRYRSLVFVSKSVGTYMAGQAAKRITSLPIRHLFLTPIRSALPLMHESGGTVFVGDQDATLDAEQVAQLVAAANLTVTVIPGANHSLEIDGDIGGSLRVLGQVGDRTFRLVREAE